jgi:mono/diheme cytochrome c family protein
MSDKHGMIPPEWIAEGRGLASRYSILSGVAITFILFGLIVVPALLREREAPKRVPSDQPAAPSVGWLDQAEAPPSKGRDLPPVDPATVMTSNATLLAKGEKIFKQNCTSCHGETGHGDGPAAGTLNPKPRDFSQPNGWTNGYHITDIFKTITNGVKGTGMAAFDFIRPADRMALVHYVRSLGSFDHGKEDPQATKELADQFRSKGFHIPNHIPVSMAIQKMVAEERPIPPLTVPANHGEDSATEQLLHSVIQDPVRVARTVAETTMRNDPAAVARAWAAGAPSNGFAVEVATLDKASWQSVVDTLIAGESVAPAPGAEQAR